MVTDPLATPPQGVDTDAWEAACAAVRTYCGWHIAPSVTETVTVDGSGGSIQLLPTLHLTDLASITNDGAAVDAPEWSTAGIVRGWWTHKFRGVTATMTHGHEEAPSELTSVLTALAEAEALETGGARRLTYGPFTVEYNQDTALGASSTGPYSTVLDRYRIPGLR